MSSWGLFIISIGLIIVASSPLFSNQIFNIIFGLVLILIGVIILKKIKRGD